MGHGVGVPKAEAKSTQYTLNLFRQNKGGNSCSFDLTFVEKHDQNQLCELGQFSRVGL